MFAVKSAQAPGVPRPACPSMHKAERDGFVCAADVPRLVADHVHGATAGATRGERACVERKDSTAPTPRSTRPLLDHIVAGIHRRRS